MQIIKPLMIVCVLAISGCGEATTPAGPPAGQSSTSEPITGRWYNQSQLTLGTRVFAENCATCHGSQAEGTVSDWRQRLDDGSFPPPPLNGSAHAWHHPLSVLLQVIDYGGADIGGKMPAFESVLNDEQKLAAISYFQSFWTDDIYGQWMQMGGEN